jgi:hypothetical protein
MKEKRLQRAIGRLEEKRDQAWRDMDDAADTRGNVSYFMARHKAFREAVKIMETASKGQG